MTVSSIFHFFAHLMERRGYFGQDGKLEDFDFPEQLIAARGGRQGFPDLVLKSNEAGPFTGGEFIELKETQSLQIASFNSTPPSAMKSVDVLQEGVINQLHELGEAPYRLPEREVYYLIRGRKRVNPAPISKTVLVSGRFFETVPIDDVLRGAFEQVTKESASDPGSEPRIPESFVVKQNVFAATRQVEGASVKVRFRVMIEADGQANLLSDRQFPQIRDDTLTLLVHDESLPDADEFTDPSDWHSVPSVIEESQSFANLEAAYDEIDTQLKLATSVFVLQHPKNGPFFAAQASIH